MADAPPRHLGVTMLVGDRWWGYFRSAVSSRSHTCLDRSSLVRAWRHPFAPGSPLGRVRLVALRADGPQVGGIRLETFGAISALRSELGVHGVGMPNHALEATAYRAPLRLLVRLGLFCLPARLTSQGCASALIR